jgi:predicted kinase
MVTVENDTDNTLLNGLRGKENPQKPLLILPVGISGSGKSFLFGLFQSHFDLCKVCMDDLRKELTGDISNQSKNNEIWELSRKSVRDLLSAGKNIYYDATNLGMKTLEGFIKDYGHIADIVIIFCTDSLDKKLCYDRVCQDIEKGIDRADTRYNDIIDKQQDRYMGMGGTREKFNLKMFAQERNVELFIRNWDSYVSMFEDIVSNIKIWQKRVAFKREYEGYEVDTLNNGEKA